MTNPVRGGNEATEAGRWTAPWTPEQVAALNAYQTSGHMHPYTCPHHGGAPRLIAFTAGWRCAGCTYKQDWAHAIPREPLADLPAGLPVEPRSDSEGWLPPLAAERLFEQRDTAITERDQLREQVATLMGLVNLPPMVIGSEPRVVFEGTGEWAREVLRQRQADAEAQARVVDERDTAIRERDEARSSEIAAAHEALYDLNSDADEARTLLEGEFRDFDGGLVDGIGRLLVQRNEARAERDQLRYERRLLGFARMTLDLVAASEPDRWAYARRQAEDIAQRIVDEIGHPVTDEDALGPSFREQIAAMRPVVEAARSWRNRIVSPPNLWADDEDFAVIAAVDAYTKEATP